MQTTTNPNPRTPKEKTWRSACHSALFTPLHLLPGGWRWKVLQEVLKWHCFDIAFFQVTSLPNPGGERFMPAVTVERTATASAVLFYDSETLNIPIPLSVQYVTPRWQHLHSSESHRAHRHSRRPGRCGVHGCISASRHDEDAQPLKSIHVKQTKEQSESKITMKSCDILFFVSLYMQIYFFLIRFDFVTSNIGKMNRSICRAEKRISFRKSRHAFIFTRKTTQISQPPPIRELSIRAQSLALACCTEIFAKKKHSKKKRKEQWNDKPLRDCGRLSRHEWARVTLPQAVSPSISGSVTSSQPRSAWCFFPCSWWAAMAGSVKCTRLVHRSADGDLSRHRRAT